MISSLKTLIVGTVAMIGLASTANAAYVADSWTDSLDINHYVAGGSSHTYSHNILEAGFNPGADFVTNFSLAIDLYDDASDGIFTRYGVLEVADVDISNMHAGYVFDFGNNAFAGWTLSGLIQLNLAGTLTVAVSSVCNILVCGDFNIGNSTLVANGYSQVPEPSAIALLGIGLLGIGLARRRKTNLAK